MGARIGRRATALTLAGVVLVCVACTGPGGAVPSPATPSPSQLADVQARVSAAIEAWIPLGHRRALRGVVVNLGGRTVAEWYAAGSRPDQARDVESVTKSVMSALVGIAIGERKIRSTAQTLGELLPTYAPTMRPAVKATTLRQVLTMTGGMTNEVANNLPTFMKHDDWTAGVLADADPSLAGTFQYSNGSAHLLSAILERATGTSVIDYARSKLFDPLGIDSAPAFEPLAVPKNVTAYLAATFAWPVDPQDRQTGWALLTLRPRDMAKIGELYRAGGRWQGRQVIPAAWVKRSTTGQVQASGAGEAYGYLWWVGTSAGQAAYRAVGFGGQLIEVVPGRGLVVAVSSRVNLSDPSDQGVTYPDLAALVDTVIAPALAP